MATDEEMAFGLNDYRYLIPAANLAIYANKIDRYYASNPRDMDSVKSDKVFFTKLLLGAYTAFALSSIFYGVLGLEKILK
jgi:hypothetical protein